MNELPIQLTYIKDPNEVWKSCLSIIKEKIPFITYSTWFLPIVPLEISDSTLTVRVPSEFFVEWIEEHYNSIINNAITQVLGKSGKLLYDILEVTEDQISAPEAEEYPKKAEFSASDVNTPEFESNLNPKYLFENFIKGESNQLARAAAIAVSDNPGKTSFNPLFIYGGVGLGKTHIIQAIGNKIVSKDKFKKVIYISADTFTVEFVEAIQSNKSNEFSHFYRNMDVLIIDDIQFLIGKEKTQDHFFHIFNALHQSGKQVVLSSDKPPKDLQGLSERLVSRFQWGLTADIQAPDFETRIAILKDKSESFGIVLSNQILEFIASNITSNIRELEGCLIKLLANSSLSSREIDFEMVKKTVKEISTVKPNNISIENITSAVCKYFGVDENKVREKNRKKEVALARQIAMYLSKEMTRSSLKTIGLHFGGRDHSTVIHAYNVIENLINNDFPVKEKIDYIKNKIELNAV